MAGSANAKLKPLYLLQIFQEQTDEEHPLSAQELCGELEKRGVAAQRKSIYGDIELLKSFGLDILHTRAPKSGYFLASRTFETAEVRLLLDAVQAAAFITPKKTAQLVQKLEGLVSCGRLPGWRGRSISTIALNAPMRKFIIRLKFWIKPFRPGGKSGSNMRGARSPAR